MGAYILIAPLPIFKIGSRKGGYEIPKTLSIVLKFGDRTSLSCLGDWRVHHTGCLAAFYFLFSFFIIFVCLFVYKEDYILLMPTQSGF
jgi:hypothetical protein